MKKQLLDSVWDTYQELVEEIINENELTSPKVELPMELSTFPEIAKLRNATGEKNAFTKTEIETFEQQYLTPAINSLDMLGPSQNTASHFASFAETSQSDLMLNMESSPNLVVDRILEKMAPAVLMDIGCGAGHHLLAFCSSHPNSFGFGLDRSKVRIEQATKQAKQLGLDERLFFAVGDIFSNEDALSETGPTVVLVSSLLNDFINEPVCSLQLLKLLKGLGSVDNLVIADYYSPNWKDGAYNSADEAAYIHDIYQLLCGRGTPPSSDKVWFQRYEEAGWEIAIHETFSTKGFRHFIHIAE